MGVSFSAEFFFAAAALISFGTVVMCSLSLVRRQGKACLPGCVWCCVHSRPRHVAELGFKAVILPLSAGRAAYCVRMEKSHVDGIDVAWRISPAGEAQWMASAGQDVQ